MEPNRLLAMVIAADFALSPGNAATGDFREVALGGPLVSGRSYPRPAWGRLVSPGGPVCAAIVEAARRCDIIATAACASSASTSLPLSAGNDRPIPQLHHLGAPTRFK